MSTDTPAQPTRKTELARLWREVNGSARWPADVDAFIEAMLAASPQPTAAQPLTWQPIETAPKDGTMFLCWVLAERWTGMDGELSSHGHDVSQVDFCWWRSVFDAPEGGYFDNAGGQIADRQDVTHWMPLPAQPGASAAPTQEPWPGPPAKGDECSDGAAPTQSGIKQMCRDSYAAGMGDPLVCAKDQAAPVAELVGPSDADRELWNAMGCIADDETCLRMLRAHIAAASAELVEALQAARDLLADMPIPDGYYSDSNEVISKLDAALSSAPGAGMLNVAGTRAAR